MRREKEFSNLISYMAKCQRCKEIKSKTGKEYSLINIFEKEDFAKNIPSIWTDWYHRLNAKVMIIGQDWGPYSDMKKLHDEYVKLPTKENWNYLISLEKSSTKKMLEKYIVESSERKVENLDNIYITNAIMCARKGDSYRGDNIHLKKSTHYCEEFLKKQIEIVRPRIIATLGYYPISALSSLYKFPIEKTLKETIKKQPVIMMEDFIVMPLYHPVAQVKKEEQIEQYKKIWQYL